MSKISKAFFAIGQLIRRPVLLNRVLDDPDIWKAHVKEKYSLDGGLPVVGFRDIFGEGYSDNLPLFSFLDGGSLVTDVALLRGLAKKTDKCAYFEIGTWRGESAVNLADITDVCFTLNLSDDELRKMNVSEGSIGQQGFFSKNFTNVTHLKGNSDNFDFAGLNRKFDLVFIDGSHHYEQVKNDTRKIFENLVHADTVVVWHDYGVTPEHIRFEVLAGILDGLPAELRSSVYHVAHTKSAVLLRKSYKGGALETPVLPEGYFEVSIKYIPVEKERN